MKANLTELVFILDRSGSMIGLEADTIGGYNSMLKEQKETEGEAFVTTVLFDDRFEVLHDRLNIKGVAPITEKEYYVRGSTALLDSVGRSIHKIINVQRNTTEDMKAEKVLFVITTDGYENASREYTYEKIKSMIKHQKEKYGWEFIFLGANIDAAAEAEKFGIGRDRAARYHNDREGVELNFRTVSNATMKFRARKSIPDDWKKDIDEDYEKRNK